MISLDGRRRAHNHLILTLPLAATAGGLILSLVLGSGSLLWNGIPALRSTPFTEMPGVICQFAMSRDADWQVLAWGGAIPITVTILLRNILARWVASRGSFQQ